MENSNPTDQVTDIQNHDLVSNDDASLLEHLAENQSESTNHGFAKLERITNYENVQDKSIFHATQIRCCLCGVMMQPNNSNTCLPCLKAKIDITEELEKKINIHHCKMCNRFRRPPWEILELESPALLSHCLK